MNSERLKEIEHMQLKDGAHESLGEGACIMELVAYVAGEPWSDQPTCACPILTRYAITLNDNFNHEHRQLLKPFVSQLIGTRSTAEVQAKREQLLMFRYLTATYPVILDLINMTELADKFRALGNNKKDMNEAFELLGKHDEEISDASAKCLDDEDDYGFFDACSYANKNAYSYAETYGDPHAHFGAGVTADVAAYTAAYAYSDAMSAKIANVEIETLKMAIEIKDEK